MYFKWFEFIFQRMFFHSVLVLKRLVGNIPISSDALKSSKMEINLLAKAECNFNIPMKIGFSVEGLKCLHAGIPITARHITVMQNRSQQHPAMVVIVATLHS